MSVFTAIFVVNIVIVSLEQDRTTHCAIVFFHHSVLHEMFLSLNTSFQHIWPKKNNKHFSEKVGDTISWKWNYYFLKNYIHNVFYDFSKNCNNFSLGYFRVLTIIFNGSFQPIIYVWMKMIKIHQKEISWRTDNIFIYGNPKSSTYYICTVRAPFRTAVIIIFLVYYKSAFLWSWRNFFDILRLLNVRGYY